MARSYVYDGTEWIKEDEILPPSTEANNISYDNTESGLSAENVQDAIDELADEKVDKEAGKGLFSGSYDDLTNRPQIPSIPSGTNNGDILVWNGAEWVAQTPSRLPAEYQEVEYIESTGTQYLRPDIKLGDFTGMTADMQFTDDVQGGYCGVYYTDGGSIWHAFSFGIRPPTHNFAIQYSAPSSTIKELYTGNTNRYRWKVDILRKKIYLNNDAYSLSIVEVTVPYNIALFARYNHSPEEGIIETRCKMKGYEFIFYDTFNSEVSHLIPCYRKSDNEIGMYDLVTNTFYTNQGTGTFLKGADVNA